MIVHGKYIAQIVVSNVQHEDQETSLFCFICARMFLVNFDDCSLKKGLLHMYSLKLIC